MGKKIKKRKRYDIFCNTKVWICCNKKAKSLIRLIQKLSFFPKSILKKGERLGVGLRALALANSMDTWIELRKPRDTGACGRVGDTSEGILYYDIAV